MASGLVAHRLHEERARAGPRGDLDLPAPQVLGEPQRHLERGHLGDRREVGAERLPVLGGEHLVALAALAHAAAFTRRLMRAL